jgi:hypothetical protein
MTLTTKHRSPDEFALALSGPLGQWGRAVEMERLRLKGDEMDSDVRPADAALFVVAVRNVVRVARAVAALRKDPQLDAAITAVDAAVPGARSVRSALDHVDAYTAHRGRFRGPHPTSAGYRIVNERTDGRDIIFIGDLAFDVDLVTKAAQDLAEASQKAINRMVVSEARA